MAEGKEFLNFLAVPKNGSDQLLVSDGEWTDMSDHDELEDLVEEEYFHNNTLSTTTRENKIQRPLRSAQHPSDSAKKGDLDEIAASDLSNHNNNDHVVPHMVVDSSLTDSIDNFDNPNNASTISSPDLSKKKAPKLGEMKNTFFSSRGNETGGSTHRFQDAVKKAGLKGMKLTKVVEQALSQNGFKQHDRMEQSMRDRRDFILFGVLRDVASDVTSPTAILNGHGPGHRPRANTVTVGCPPSPSYSTPPLSRRRRSSTFSNNNNNSHNSHNQNGKNSANVDGQEPLSLSQSSEGLNFDEIVFESHPLTSGSGKKKVYTKPRGRAASDDTFSRRRSLFDPAPSTVDKDGFQVSSKKLQRKQGVRYQKLTKTPSIVIGNVDSKEEDDGDDEMKYNHLSSKRGEMATSRPPGGLKGRKRESISASVLPSMNIRSIESDILKHDSLDEEEFRGRRGSSTLLTLPRNTKSSQINSSVPLYEPCFSAPMDVSSSLERAREMIKQMHPDPALALQPDLTRLQAELSQCRRLFEKLDVDNDGLVSMDVVRNSMLDSAGGGFSPDEVEIMLSEVCCVWPTHDINFAEFKAMCLRGLTGRCKPLVDQLAAANPSLRQHTSQQSPPVSNTNSPSMLRSSPLSSRRFNRTPLIKQVTLGRDQRSSKGGRFSSPSSSFDHDVGLIIYDEGLGGYAPDGSKIDHQRSASNKSTLSFVTPVDHISDV